MSNTSLIHSQLTTSTLRILLDAGEVVLESQRALHKGGLNLVGECLKGQGDFYELSHYPADDVFDSDSKSQYYFHTHRGLDGEYGHFHTFLRAAGMPPAITPIRNSGTEPWPEGEDALSHLICIAMNRDGLPIGLFTTNRWVTGETWYKAEDVIAMVQAQIGVESLVDVEQIVQFCMMSPMQAKPLAWDSKELAALSAFVVDFQKGYKPK